METNNEYRRYPHYPVDEHGHGTNNKVAVGVILVLAGLFLILRNTGLFPNFINRVIFSWQMLLVVIGLVMTVNSGKKTAGIIVMAVGAFFMIPLLFRQTFHMYNLFWPAILIIAGVLFISSRGKGWSGRVTRDSSDDDYIDYINIFSGGDRQILSRNFRGGKITAIFGGTELDLTQAGLAPGKNEIEITCVFGGITVIVPETWYVTIEVTPVLGGFNDSRKLKPGSIPDPDNRLIIRGTVVMGGGEVKSF
jgi:predicted membrane protein